MLLATALNFRPLGLPFLASSPPPGSVRLYRSGELSRLSAEDATHLADTLGVRTYLDLRSEQEILASGPPRALLERGITWRRLSIPEYSSAAIAGDSPGPSHYARYYMEVLDAGASCFVEALGFIAEQASLPLVFGCFAGKDRTGVLATLLLSLLGATADEIAADYALSAPFLLARADWFEAKWLKKKTTRERYLVRLETREETIHLFLDEVQRRHGSPRDFLRGLGLSPRVEEALRTRLLETNAPSEPRTSGGNT
jgi:protein-tyrosine phosphatase